jgi:hypothetical protein
MSCWPLSSSVRENPPHRGHLGGLRLYSKQLRVVCFPPTAVISARLPYTEYVLSRGCLRQHTTSCLAMQGRTGHSGVKVKQPFPHNFPSPRGFFLVSRFRRVVTAQDEHASSGSGVRRRLHPPPRRSTWRCSKKRSPLPRHLVIWAYCQVAGVVL